MKIKPFFLTCMWLLVSVLLYTGCSSPANNDSNSALKTKDDLISTLKQCKQFAKANNVNVDSCLKVSGFLLTKGDPPVVVLNDTVYIYFGQGAGKPLQSSNGDTLTQVKAKYYIGTTEYWSYIGIDSIETMSNYNYRIAIPLNNFVNPAQNLEVNRISTVGPGPTSGMTEKK